MLRALIFVSIIIFAAIVLLSTHYLTQEHDTYQALLSVAKSNTEENVAAIDTILLNTEKVANSLARALEDPDLSKEDIIRIIKEKVAQGKTLNGVGVAFKPYQFKSDTRLFAPYYVQNPNTKKFDIQAIENKYDYTIRNTNPEAGPITQWYYAPLDLKKGAWLEPYYGSASGTFIAEYSRPFYRINKNSGKKEIVGVVIVSFSVDEIRRKLLSLPLLNDAYPYMFTSKGNIIVLPRKEFSGIQTLKELYQEQPDSSAKARIAAVQKHQNIILKFSGYPDYERHILIQRGLKQSNWSMGIVFSLEGRSYINTPGGQKTLIAISILSSIFIVLMITIFSKAYLLEPRSLWLTSFSTFIICILNTILIIYISEIQLTPHTNRISNQQQINRIIHNVQNTSTPGADIRHFIPTGLYIHSLKFPSNAETTLAGYIWQKIPIKDANKGLEDFSFPSSISNLGANSRIKLEEKRVGKNMIHLWQFLISIRNYPDVEKYPFDTKHLQLSIWPKHVSSDVMLVPDLESYAYILPSTLPGLSKEISHRGWVFDQTYFSLRRNDLNVDFGLNQKALLNANYTMKYNIILKRTLIDAFLSYCIPMIIVCLMMFSITMIKQEKDNKSIFGVLSYSAAMFFVISLSHHSLRSNLEANTVTYLEHIYMVVYSILLLVPLNEVLYLSDVKIKWIQYRENLLAKLLYWPYIGIAILVSTMICYMN